MRKIILLFIGFAAFGADDSWKKLRGLKSGGELRIFKKNSRQPVIATLDEAVEERIVVIVKNEQVSIAKEDIDRIDYRPPQRGSRMARETKVTSEAPKYEAQGRPGPKGDSSGPSGSSSSSVSFGGKGDFETVYRRMVVAAPKPAGAPK